MFGNLNYDIDFKTEVVNSKMLRIEKPDVFQFLRDFQKTSYLMPTITVVIVF